MTAYILKLVSGGNDLAALIFGIVVLLALLLVADSLIERRPFFGRLFWALVDSAVHGLVAVLVTAPIARRAPTTQQTLLLLGLAFLAGTLVDLDHLLAASSRSLWTATHLEKRPPTHSVTFALLLGVVGYTLSRNLSTAWVVFAAVTSHVLRDASVGTAPILWPLRDWRIPRWAYYLGELGVLIASHWIAPWRSSGFLGIGRPHLDSGFPPEGRNAHSARPSIRRSRAFSSI